MLDKIFFFTNSFINLLLSMFDKKTFSARALVIRDDEILLITHIYLPGRYSIGRSVEKGESTIDAIEIELIEEVGIILTIKPILFNIYHNQHGKCDNYIVFYICKNFIENNYKQNNEIKEKNGLN